MLLPHAHYLVGVGTILQVKFGMAVVSKQSFQPQCSFLMHITLLGWGPFRGLNLEWLLFPNRASNLTVQLPYAHYLVGVGTILWVKFGMAVVSKQSF